MSSLLLAAGSAFWLGVLTSISPCPLASNVAAITYVARGVGRPRRVLLCGAVYSLGRSLSYVLVAALVVESLLSIPRLSFFLQERMNQVLGPLLLFAGVGMLIWHRLRLPSVGFGQGIQERAGRSGVLGAGLLGVLFALSFCPVSAGLFFGALIPLAVGSSSRLLLPAIYGLGTGLPVALFAALLVLGAQWVGRTYRILTRIERGARPVTGAVFILAGLYLSLIHLFGVDL